MGLPGLLLIAGLLVYYRILELPRPWLTAIVSRLPGPLPVHKFLRAAHSGDGMTWVVVSGVLAESASSPHLVRIRGALTVFFVRDGTDLYRVGLDGGAPERVRIVGEGRGMTVDPHVVHLPDGRLRLYYVYQTCWCDPGSGIYNEIHSAVSDDGRTWRREEGIRLEGAYVDPDVVVLPDGAWRMYITADTSRVHSAHSTDGLTFRLEPGVRMSGGCVSSTVSQDADWWMYVHQPRAFPSRIWRARSSDGLNFEPATPVIFSGDNVPSLPMESPAVAMDDGTWRMVYASTRR